MNNSEKGYCVGCGEVLTMELEDEEE